MAKNTRQRFGLKVNGQYATCFHVTNHEWIVNGNARVVDVRDSDQRVRDAREAVEDGALVQTISHDSDYNQIVEWDRSFDDALAWALSEVDRQLVVITPNDKHLSSDVNDAKTYAKAYAHSDWVDEMIEARQRFGDTAELVELREVTVLREV